METEMETEMISKNENCNLETRWIPIGTLGLIVTFFKQYGISQFVDQILPKDNEHNVTHGECLLSMMLVALAFFYRPLYTVNEVMKHIPLFYFFGRDIDYSDFNDDVFGSFFEAICDYGSSEFFVKVVDHIHSLESDLIESTIYRASIAKFSVFSEYNRTDEDHALRIVYEQPKDEHNRFKLFSLFLLSNADGIPVFMKELPGNCSDNKEFVANVRKAMKDIGKKIQLNQNLYFIGDTEFYCKENIQDFGAFFITRVPATLKTAMELIDSDNVDMKPVEGDDRYLWYMLPSDYGEVKQSWFLFSSSEMLKRREKTFSKKLSKVMEDGEKDFKVLSQQPFTSVEDARREASRWAKKHELLKLSAMEIEEKEIRASVKPGRSKKDEPLIKQYFITGKVKFDDVVVEKERLKLGLFILATNDTTLAAEEVLKFYKQQNIVENDFRFLKGNNFHFSKILLKNTSRIQGFYSFMSLLLLIYSTLDLKLRKGLKQNGEFLVNKINKNYLNPTLLHAFQEFKYFGALVSFNCSLTKTRLYFPFSDPANEYMKIILRALGEPYEKFYSFDSGIMSNLDGQMLAKFIKRRFKELPDIRI
jgi:transposase